MVEHLVYVQEVLGSIPSLVIFSVLTEDDEAALVKLIVIDGIVMGPQHCAFNNCTADLMNSHGGVFCSVHDIQYAAKYRVKNCP